MSLMFLKLDMGVLELPVWIRIPAGTSGRFLEEHLMKWLCTCKVWVTVKGKSMRWCLSTLGLAKPITGLEGKSSKPARLWLYRRVQDTLRPGRSWLGRKQTSPHVCPLILSKWLPLGDTNWLERAWETLAAVSSESSLLAEDSGRGGADGRCLHILLT